MWFVIMFALMFLAHIASLCFLKVSVELVISFMLYFVLGYVSGGIFNSWDMRD